MLVFVLLFGVCLCGCLGVDAGAYVGLGVWVVLLLVIALLVVLVLVVVGVNEIVRYSCLCLSLR